MRCAVIRHVAFEDLGVWEGEIGAHGYQIEYLDSGVDDLESAVDAEITVVLGGPVGVADRAQYPSLALEVELIARRLESELPTLGVCLGAQLMATALDASVRPGAVEIGWGELDLTADALAGPLRHLDGEPVLHWHGEQCDLPAGARLLASTTATRVQAFAHGSGLALQFHPEADAERIDQWLMGHAVEMAAHGVDPVALRARSRDVGDAAAMAGVRLIRAWLREVAAQSSA